MGVIFRKLNCEPAPLFLGFVVGPLFEENLRRSLIVSRGDPAIFIQRPISAGLLAVAALILIVSFLPAVLAKREKAFKE